MGVKNAVNSGPPKEIWKAASVADRLLKGSRVGSVDSTEWVDLLHPAYQPDSEDSETEASISPFSSTTQTQPNLEETTGPKVGKVEVAGEIEDSDDEDESDKLGGVEGFKDLVSRLD